MIVPLHGRVDHLEYQIGLMSLNDSFKDQELILVLDDPQNRRSVLRMGEGLRERFGIPFKLCMLDRNTGFGPASNIGLRVARGRFACFLGIPSVFPRGLPTGWNDGQQGSRNEHGDNVLLNLILIRMRRMFDPQFRGKTQQEALNMNDGDACPLALVYSQGEAAALFSRFSRITFRLTQLSWRQLFMLSPLVRLAEKYLPSSSESWPARVMGWNLNIQATKPD